MVSFPNSFALNNGLITKRDYYDLTNNVLPSFLMNAGFKLDNTSWYAVLHRNTKNPHLHIVVFEKNKIRIKDSIDLSSINKLKSLIANYIVDNKDFYITRDKEFKSIIGDITSKEFTKFNNSNLFSNLYRKNLNNILLSLYNKLPSTGRLQYNSKSMIRYKNDIDFVIDYILSHDSIKYKFEEYKIILMKNQKELNNMYGDTKSNKSNKYLNDQIKRIYSKIGNDILKNFKIYQATNTISRERDFLKRHIYELNFKSRNDYLKDDKKIEIAKSLYKMCLMVGLNYSQTKRVINNWNNNSKYKFDVDSLMSSFNILSSDMSSAEFYGTLKKLGYDYNKYKKFRDKNFYKEINYKVFFNRAINHIMYELEQEEKELTENIRYDLEGY